MKFSEILRKAEDAVGITENPAGSNRTIFAPIVDAEWPIGFTRQGSQWCGTFQEWLLGKEMLHGISVFSVAYGLQKFKMMGLFTTVPEPGFVSFYSFTPDRYPGHVGWVKDVVGSNLIDAIEGNTQPGVQGQQANGGGVYQRTRQGAVILGYGKIFYEPEEDLEVISYMIKSNSYKNVFGIWTNGTIRAMYGDEEYAKYANAGIPLVTVRDDEILKALELAGPGSGPLVPV